MSRASLTGARTPLGRPRSSLGLGGSMHGHSASVGSGRPLELDEADEDGDIPRPHAEPAGHLLPPGDGGGRQRHPGAGERYPHAELEAAERRRSTLDRPGREENEQRRQPTGSRRRRQREDCTGGEESFRDRRDLLTRSHCSRSMCLLAVGSTWSEARGVVFCCQELALGHDHDVYGLGWNGMDRAGPADWVARVDYSPWCGLWRRR